MNRRTVRRHAAWIEGNMTRVLDVELGPLDALGYAGNVADTAMQLVEHLVEEARQDGASWTDVGRQLGLTKQGAQQRFGPILTPPGSA